MKSLNNFTVLLFCLIKREQTFKISRVEKIGKCIFKGLRF